MHIKELLQFMTPLFSVKQLQKLTSQNLLLPFYHTVSPKPLAHIHNLYALRSLDNFEKDLDFLCRHFHAISLDTLVALKSSGQQSQNPCFHLTFDDGLSEIYTHVAPLLEQKGIPASIFINSAFVDNKDLFYRYKVSLLIEHLKRDETARQEAAALLQLNRSGLTNITHKLLSFGYHDTPLIDALAEKIQVDFSRFLSEQQPYLSKQEINDLIARGFTIGSHSCDHPHFKDLDLQTQKQQLLDSFTFLEDKFQLDHRVFSFPFSDENVTHAFITWLHTEQNCALSFGVSGLKHDSSALHLHRLPMEGSQESAQALIKSEYLYYYLKSFVNKNTIKRT